MLMGIGVGDALVDIKKLQICPMGLNTSIFDGELKYDSESQFRHIQDVDFSLGWVRENFKKCHNSFYCVPGSQFFFRCHISIMGLVGLRQS